ncbi:MAG: hypothetical protein LBV33_02600 [Lachnospiraceae bacterium]|jgi:hypothetical protein|nr:hypothetical protein [Lachnospiraceae bacterium]
MSGFGIGINTQDKDAGVIKGEQMEVACDCWFTQTGRTIPKLIRFHDGQEVIHTIDRIKVNTCEEKNHTGIATMEYDCTVIFKETEHLVKLIFFKQTCRWALIFK